MQRPPEGSIPREASRWRHEPSVLILWSGHPFLVGDRENSRCSCNPQSQGDRYLFGNKTVLVCPWTCPEPKGPFPAADCSGSAKPCGSCGPTPAYPGTPSCFLSSSLVTLGMAMNGGCPLERRCGKDDLERGLAQVKKTAVLQNDSLRRTG